MEFYISFGKDKNKENHISKINNKNKLDFSIVVSQLNKYTNEKEYAYIKAETWDWNVIEELKENKRFKMGNFYLRFYKDKNEIINWVIVIKSLAEWDKNYSPTKNKETFNKDIKELKEIFGDTLKVNGETPKENEEEDNPWELDL